MCVGRGPRGGGAALRGGRQQARVLTAASPDPHRRARCSASREETQTGHRRVTPDSHSVLCFQCGSAPCPQVQRASGSVCPEGNPLPLRPQQGGTWVLSGASRSLPVFSAVTELMPPEGPVASPLEDPSLGFRGPDGLGVRHVGGCRRRHRCGRHPRPPNPWAGVPSPVPFVFPSSGLATVPFLPFQRHLGKGRRETRAPSPPPSAGAPQSPVH